MRLVYLYGPPGVGKLTVARELVALTGFKLLHNHLTVDLVRSVFPFNSEPYVRLVRQFRRDMVAEAARVDVDLVCTGVYLGTSEQLAAIRRILEPIYASGGAVLFVQLTCRPDAWHARVPSESRRALDKLTDPERALGLFAGGDPFAAMPTEPTLRIDTTHLPPTEAAAQIAAHYALPPVEPAGPCVPRDIGRLDRPAEPEQGEVQGPASFAPTAPLVPELKVADFGRSLAFYVELAGFEILYQRPESEFAYLSLGGAELMIERDDGMWRTGPLEHPYGRGINFQIEVSEVEALHARFVARGHPIMVPIEERWYRRDDIYLGQKQFLVQDPDGYLLRFGEALGTRSEPG